MFGKTSENFNTSVGGYHFSFYMKKRWNGKIRLFIRDQPSYGSRSTNLHSTHRYSSADGYYVCIKDDLEPTNFAHARDWANYWARQTVNYIKTGRSFN